MSQVKRYLSSSIGRKVIMSVTGLSLVGFLITHLLGNLLIFIGNHEFNAYGRALTSNPLIYIAEVGLITLFVLHFVQGIILTLKNKEARSEKYQYSQPAGHTSRKSLSSKMMIFSGIALLVFIPIHVFMFKFGDHGGNLAALVRKELSNPIVAIIYMAMMVNVGFHLWHGIGSGMESLGVRYRKELRRFGQALAVFISGGFFLIPFAILTGII